MSNNRRIDNVINANTISITSNGVRHVAKTEWLKSEPRYGSLQECNNLTNDILKTFREPPEVDNRTLSEKIGDFLSKKRG